MHNFTQNISNISYTFNYKTIDYAQIISISIFVFCILFMLFMYYYNDKKLNKMETEWKLKKDKLKKDKQETNTNISNDNLTIYYI